MQRAAAAHDVAEQAVAAAKAAAAGAGAQIVLIRNAEGAHRASRVLTDIWGTGDPGRQIVPPEVIRSLAHVNGYGALALIEGETVGAALGFLGADAGGALLHSYIAGVTERCRGGSVGFALKLHQRAWALTSGLNRITWTFDPLVRRNAYFNLVKLGAEVAGFHRDFYGAMGDAVNAGDMSDRVVVEWKLDSPRAISASELRANPVDRSALDGPRPVIRLAVGGDGTPRLGAESGRRELVQIPDDIVAIRTVAPDLGRQWRLAVRETLGDAIAAGATVDGFTRDGWYLLRHPH